MSTESDLVNHHPWPQAAHAAHLGAAIDLAKIESTRQQRLGNGLVTGGATFAFLGALYLLKNAASQSVGMFLVAVGLCAAGWGLSRQSRNDSYDALLAQWRMDAGADALDDEALEELVTVAQRHPAAIQRLRSWQGLGLTLRERDRTAIETFLAAKGINVPVRDKTHLDYILSGLSEGAAA